MKILLRSMIGLAAFGALAAVGPRESTGGTRVGAPAPPTRSAAPSAPAGAPVLALPRVPLPLPGDDGPDRPPFHHEFYFTRGVYRGANGGCFFYGRQNSWRIDYPKADRQLVVVLAKTMDLLDVAQQLHPVRLEDPGLRHFPFLYMVEVGSLHMTEEEVQALRSYLQAGGFLMVDDFWGTCEWQNLEHEMRRVFPDRPIKEIPLSHPVFHTYYDIDRIIQVPNAGNGCRGGPTWERDGYVAHARGIFDDEGRLMVAINWNTDLGDAWEWSEQPCYPFKYSNFAYKMLINYIVYSMTH